jgi:aryl-alcohol dehydrogenase-like predicted oxidoreductase
MRTVELVPGIKSSALGFGCAPILGSVDCAAARRALAVALDHGVTHFDVARSYGYGEAEGFLGRYLQARRGQVVLATKFGIVATLHARFLRPLKPLVRWAKKLQKPAPSHEQPGYRQLSLIAPLTLGDRFHERVAMVPANLRASVEKSLRELRTDYLDYLLLHEPRDALCAMHATVEEVVLLKKQGKIRAWGLAFKREFRPPPAVVFSEFDVLQYDLSPGGPGYDRVRNERAEAANILFSPFGGAVPGLPRSEILTRLACDFPRSVVLCTMFNPEHIRANARVFHAPFC